MGRREVKAITRDLSVQGGMPVFAGTRVPVTVLFDYLKEGQPLDAFLQQYPSVSREKALAAIEESEALLVAAL